MSGRSERPRSLHRLQAALSDRDLSILRSVAELRLVSAGQLQALHFDGDHQSSVTAARTCRRVLERLTELHVLRRLERVIGGVRAGSAAYIYGVGPTGHRLLQNGRARHGFREPSMTFLRHTLAVSGVVATLATAAKQGEVQVLEYQAEPACWRSLAGYGAADTLRPDLRLVVARGEMEWHWFVEVDLGSEHGPTISRKCAQYLCYYQSGCEQRDRGIFPKVAWLTTTTQRAERLRALTTAAAGDLPLFEVGLLGTPLPLLLPEDDR